MESAVIVTWFTKEENIGKAWVLCMPGFYVSLLPFLCGYSFQ